LYELQRCSMMGQELSIIKLGGALLTDKSTPFMARDAILKAVAREIKECIDGGLLQSLILIHGVGSYGHPPVLEHGLHKGFQGSEQLLPLSRTQQIVQKFRNMITVHFQDVGIPVNLMLPSSMVVSEKMRMNRYFLEPLKGWLSLGMVPLLGGDMLYDTKMGFSVGSGDPLAVLLCRELGASRLIFATDVPGIYETDPKIDAAAVLLEEINLNELEQVLERMGKAAKADASGVMKGKLNALIPAKDLIEKGLEVSIISMMEYGHLKALLKGEKDKHTRIIV
jgi:isopentenyl phosphate kinase